MSERAWERMVEYREVRIGSGSMAACAVCAHAAGVSPVFFGVDEVMRSLDLQRPDAGPCDGVMLTGCEPFSHPRLPEIVGAVRRAGATRVCLRTDAGALSVGGNAPGALAAGVTHIDVVMLAAGEDNDRLTGVKGLFAASEAGVRAFLDAAKAAGRRVAVSGYVPVCRHNAALAAHAVARLVSLGALSVRIDASAARSEHHMFVRAAIDTATVNGVYAWTEGELDPVTPFRGRAPWREVPGVCA